MGFKKAVELTKEIRKVKGVISIFSPGVAASKTLKDVDLVVFYSNKTESSVKNVEELVAGKLCVKHIDLDELKKDAELKSAMSGEGVLLHGKAVDMTAEGSRLKSRMILSYDTTKMNQNDRNKLNRALYGGISTYRKDGKRIVKEYPGLVERVHAEKLGKGVLMVDRFNSSMIIQTFKSFSAQWREIPVWTY
ncbi:MAG: hypothetical protein PHQ17_08180 [Methanobacterium sp.]|jgi:hypothetical protein|nr:hypothetical protein [Methanobacterium sp.]